jgi:hypothetical protein
MYEYQQQQVLKVKVLVTVPTSFKSYNKKMDDG